MRLKAASFITEILFASLFFCSLPSVFAENIFPDTISDKDRGFITNGEFDIPFGCPEIVLNNLDAYEDWLLAGIHPDEIDTDLYICTISALNFQEEKIRFRVTFSINKWPIKKKKYTIPLLIKDIVRNKDNMITSFRLEADKNHSSARLIKNLEYQITLAENQGTKVLRYNGICKLCGIYQCLFSLKMYRKNSEIYINKFTENFLDEIRRQK